MANADLAAEPVAERFSRVKLLLALSRTPHGLLDLAAPALAALLWLGRFPPLEVTALGLLTVFAGYTAVYALNDLVDCRVDREKLRLQAEMQGGRQQGSGPTPYLDAVFVRHPLAAGKVRPPEALLWTGAWALVSLWGAYLLNPMCAVIFLAGCALETAYCLLLRVSHLRFLVAGVVKGLGALAAVLAVDPRPAPRFLAALFLWLFFWELGGQNIPADWHDVEQDHRLNAKTIPVIYGLRKSRSIVVLSLALSLVFSLIVLRLGPTPFSLFQQMLILGVGVFLLLLPARNLLRPGQPQAAALFNRASYYPAAVLAVVLLRLVT